MSDRESEEGGQSMKAGAMRVLFLGNSHTTNNELPKMIEQLFHERREDGLEIVVHADTEASFEWHWESGRSRELLAEGEWDSVVLQGRPEASDDSSRFMEFGKRLVEEAERQGAKEILLFDPWMRYGHFEDQYAFNELYERLAEATVAHVIPVGEAWRSLLQAYPDIRLHADDNFHAAPSGTYLSACVFFRAFSGEDPAGLSSRLQWQGQPLVSLDKTDAAKLQEIAEAVMEEIWP